MREHYYCLFLPQGVHIQTRCSPPRGSKQGRPNARCMSELIVIPGEWFSRPALEGFRRWVSVYTSTWGGRRAHSHVVVKRSRFCVCTYWITAAVYSPEVLHSYNPSANPPRGSRVIREPNRFWIYEKFPSRRFISVKTSRERNTVYLSGRAQSAGKPRNSRDFTSHRCARNHCYTKFI